MNKKPYSDLVSGIGISLLSIFIIISSSSIEENAKTFPVFIAICLGVLSLLITVESILITRKKLKNTSASIPISYKMHINFWSPQELQKNFSPLIVAILCILFLLLFTRIGFEISAFGLILSIMLVISWKEAFGKIYIAVVTPTLLILIFYYGLKLRLPLLIAEIFK